MHRTPARRRRGWSLIEVMVALALLAGAAVLLIDAQIRSLRQVRHAQDLRQAKRLAEGLMQQWQEAGYPRHAPAVGSFAGQEAWRWRYNVQTVFPLELNQRIEMHLVQLEVDAPLEVSQGGHETTASFHWLVGTLRYADPVGHTAQDGLYPP